MKVNKPIKIKLIDDYEEFVYSQKKDELDTCENVATIYLSENMVDFRVEYTVSHINEKGEHVVAYCNVKAYDPEDCVKLIEEIQLLKLDLKITFIEIVNYTHIIEDIDLIEEELDRFLTMCKDYYSDKID